MRLLVVDDDDLMHLTLKSVFHDAEIISAKTIVEAEKLISAQTFNVAFIDIQLNSNGSGEGVELLRRIRDRDSYLPCIMMSGLEEPKIILRCLELGAVDYIAKGVVSPEAYRLATYKSALWRKLLTESPRARTPFAQDSTHEIRGESKAVIQLRQTLSKLGTLPGPFLIMGESGTGKELVARSLWAAQNNPLRPFVAVNCASLPENLIESELFGFERGAFTGAQNAKTGLFEAANGGDIFLDEIGELSMDLQAKLLRVLQEKTVRRLGSDRERRIDVRVIAATHVDIPQAIEEKEFREDLFYRLNVHPIFVPPLRERREDIELLINYFTQQNGIRNIKIDAEAKVLLETFLWPGNIRQLRSLCEYIRTYLDMADPRITQEVVSQWLTFNRPRKKEERAHEARNPLEEVRQALTTKSVIEVLSITDNLRRAYVEAALSLSSDNRSKAAKVLGLSRQRLSNWMSEWGL